MPSSLFGGMTNKQRVFNTPKSGGSPMLSGTSLDQLFQAYENRQPIRSMTSTGEGQFDYSMPDWVSHNGYQIQEVPNQGYRVYQNLPQGADQLDFNDKPFDIYNKNKQYVGTSQFKNMGGGPVLNALDKAWDTAIPALTMAFIGGGIGGAFGQGPMAEPGGFFNPGTTGGVPPNPFMGGGIGGGVGSGGGGVVPPNPFYTGAGSSGGGLGGILNQIGLGGSGGVPNLGSLIKSGLGAILSGGGGGGGSNGGGLFGTGVGLNDIIGLIGGGVDASRQGAASQAMRDWLMSQQNKMDNYMKPDSPEWNAMWEAMSRKDAAAGRNSQYGPRTADFLAKVAEAKAANTRQFTTGTSRAYADALNQNASKYAGLSSALQRMGAGNSPVNLSSILNGIGGSGALNGIFDGSTGGQDLGDVWSGVDAWDDAWADAINGGDFIDYGEFF